MLLRWFLESLRIFTVVTGGWRYFYSATTPTRVSLIGVGVSAMKTEGELDKRILGSFVSDIRC